MNSEKKKLEIVQLSLGKTIDLNVPDISNQSKDKIDKLIDEAKKEKEALQIKTLQEDELRRCYDVLLQATETKRPISSNALLAIIDNKVPLSTLIIRLRQFARDRGNIWEIQKHRIDKITHYSMKPKA